jgi:hypothetical protein
MAPEQIGRALLLAGLLLAGLGVVLMLGGRFLPFLGQLPGDLTVRWGGGSFFFPIVTCLLLSLVLSVLLNVLLRIVNRS